MWCEKTKSGKYKYVERYYDELGIERKATTTLNKPNKKLATQIIQDKIRASTVDKHLTFQEVSNEWLEYYKNGVKLSTYARNRTHVKALNDSIGKVKYEKLNAGVFNTFILECLKSGRYKHNTAKQLHSIIRRILLYGLKFKGIDKTDIIQLLEVPKINVSESNDLKYLEPKELKIVLDHLDGEFKRLAIIQAHTGMRYGELISLDYEKDIDLDNQSIHIHKSYDVDHKIFTSTKTGDDRVIYFSDELKEIIREQIIHTKQITLKHKIPRDNHLLFKTRNGTPITHLSMNNMLKKVPIEKNVTTHIFRHTFITMAVQNKIEKELIIKQVGHADSKMIDRVYGHFTLQMQEQQKEAMKDFRII